MELIVSCQISSDALSSTGHALYSLICCYPVSILSILCFENSTLFKIRLS